MAHPIGPLIKFGKDVIRILAKSGPDPVFFIAVLIIALLGTLFFNSPWVLILLVLIVVIGYCFRMDRDGRQKINLAKINLEIAGQDVRAIRKAGRARLPVPGQSAKPKRSIEDSTSSSDDGGLK